MTIQKLNFHLLTALGLSHDSAKIVMDRIGELETSQLLVQRERDALEDGSQLRQAIGLLTCLHPSMVMMPDDPLEMARAITRHVEAARHQVETKLSDALVENAHLKEALAAGDCKDSAADNEILRAELRRLLVDECVSRSDADRIAEALKAIE